MDQGPVREVPLDQQRVAALGGSETVISRVPSGVNAIPFLSAGAGTVASTVPVSETKASYLTANMLSRISRAVVARISL